MTEEILSKLKSYVVKVILKGEEFDLDSTTPLLEIGILNSMEMMKLISFIENEFSVLMPPEKITTENFDNLDVIAKLVVDLMARTS